MKFQYKKVCMKQVPLKVSVLLGCSTILMGDLCPTFGDSLVAGVCIHEQKHYFTAHYSAVARHLLITI
jgi:hypothetical protein